MLLIVGLGNPGREYEKHRHNVGVVIVDALHRRYGFGPWRRRFSSDVAEGSVGDAKATLIKPLTYMNESGRAVGEAMRFYKLEPASVLVIHDELDLAPGKVKVKTGGGGAGHNGIRSVTGHLGPDYRRLRVGIGHPGHRDLVSSYVLRDFPKGDAEWLDPLIAALAENAPLLVAGDDAGFANRVHLATQPPKAKDDTTPSKASLQQKSARVAPRGASLTSGSDAGTVDKAGGPFAGLRKLFTRKPGAS
jgi:PTH1 family peptidyl-tRNA hydrolase